MTTDWRSGLPELPEQYDPLDYNQVENLLKLYNVEIEKENIGWGVLYKGGGGVMCPFLKNDINGIKAKAVIAFSIYLHITGVDAGLCDRVAYHYIMGCTQ